MKVKDLDLKDYNLKLTGFTVKAEDVRPRSSLHLKARHLLTEAFPTCQVLEEVAVKLKHNSRTRFLDFFIPKFNMVIEVHGEQHYKFNTKFHTSAQDFINQKKRDKDLIEWCEINNFTYIELPYSEDIKKWKTRIQSS